MKTVVLHRGTPESWVIFPAFQARVRKFTAEHASSFVDPLPDLMAAAFGMGDNRVLMVALLDEDAGSAEDVIIGHIVAGVEQYLGRNVAMVYQFERDVSDSDWVENNAYLQNIVETWASSIGLDEIMIMAETMSRGRLFRQFGYTMGPVLMRRKFDG